jgi:hypothetical protein
MAFFFPFNNFDYFAAVVSSQRLYSGAQDPAPIMVTR